MAKSKRFLDRDLLSSKSTFPYWLFLIGLVLAVAGDTLNDRWANPLMAWLVSPWLVGAGGIMLFSRWRKTRPVAAVLMIVLLFVFVYWQQSEFSSFLRSINAF